MPPYLGVARSFRSHCALVRGLPGMKAMLLRDCQRRHSLTYIVIGSHSTYRLMRRFTELELPLYLINVLPQLPSLKRSRSPMDLNNSHTHLQLLTYFSSYNLCSEVSHQHLPWPSHKRFSSPNPSQYMLVPYAKPTSLQSLCHPIYQPYLPLCSSKLTWL